MQFSRGRRPAGRLQEAAVALEALDTPEKELKKALASRPAGPVDPAGARIVEALAREQAEIDSAVDAVLPASLRRLRDAVARAREAAALAAAMDAAEARRGALGGMLKVQQEILKEAGDGAGGIDLALRQQTAGWRLREIGLERLPHARDALLAMMAAEARLRANARADHEARRAVDALARALEASRTPAPTPLAAALAAIAAIDLPDEARRALLPVTVSNRATVHASLKALEALQAASAEEHRSALEPLQRRQMDLARRAAVLLSRPHLGDVPDLAAAGRRTVRDLLAATASGPAERAALDRLAADRAALHPREVELARALDAPARRGELRGRRAPRSRPARPGRAGEGAGGLPGPPGARRLLEGRGRTDRPRTAAVRARPRPGSRPAGIVRPRRPCRGDPRRRGLERCERVLAAVQAFDRSAGFDDIDDSKGLDPLRRAAVELEWLVMSAEETLGERLPRDALASLRPRARVIAATLRRIAARMESGK
jgi:hypothetical protein